MKPPTFRRRDSAIDAMNTARSQRQANRKNTKDGLDLLVLGVYIGGGLDDLDCALVRYRQVAPNAPLRIEVIEVCTMVLSLSEPLM